MDIKDLIERIVESASSASNSHFMFTLEDTNAKHREYALDCNGDCVAHCDCYGLSVEMHEVLGCVDDAVAFLFDCDIHLWKLESYTVDVSQFGLNYWNITLKR